MAAWRPASSRFESGPKEKPVIVSAGIVAALVCAVLVIALRLRQRGAASESNTAESLDFNLDGSGRFHAVSIRFGAGACAASRDLHGRRFLSGTAPALPLENCSSDDCQCRFVHFSDRRGGDDRRHPFQKGYGGSAPRRDEDRRHLSDRRTEPPAKSTND